MPRGDKSSYTDKQKRQAEHIGEGYEKRGVSGREAARRAWATVNKEPRGGKKSGSGRGKPEDHAPSRKGGRLGGRASAGRHLADGKNRAGWRTGTGGRSASCSLVGGGFLARAVLGRTFQASSDPFGISQLEYPALETSIGPAALTRPAPSRP
jgi:plasmid stabilization system protein ParE